MENERGCVWLLVQPTDTNTVQNSQVFIQHYPMAADEKDFCSMISWGVRTPHDFAFLDMEYLSARRGRLEFVVWERKDISVIIPKILGDLITDLIESVIGFF